MIDETPRLCGCGCGKPTLRATNTVTKKGKKKGEYNRFRSGHNKSNSGRFESAEKAPKWNGGRIVTSFGYIMLYAPGHPRTGRTPYVFEHVLIAERALGRYLPKSAVVHHVNGNRTDNRPANLVICEGPGYHKLLHQRIRAFKESGHCHWVKCRHCKTWGPPEEVMRRETWATGYHKACSAAHMRSRYVPKHLRGA